MATEYRPLRPLPDRELLAQLRQLCDQHRRVEAELVAHIAEVDARRLYGEQACSSMFVYCVQQLHLSESEAYLRIAVARISRQFPQVLTALAAGRIHLSGIAKLAPCLRPDNVEALLGRAAHQTKRAIEELVAEMAPRPDVEARIRKLPARGRPAGAPGAVTGKPGGKPGAVTGNPGGDVDDDDDDDADDDDDDASPSTTSTPAAIEVAPTQLRPDQALPADGPPQARSTLATLPPAPAPGRIEPLAPARYRVQFTADDELQRKLRRAQGLLQAQGGPLDLAQVVDRAVTMLVEKLEARRFGKTRRPRTAATANPDSATVSSPATVSAPAPAPATVSAPAPAPAPAPATVSAPAPASATVTVSATVTAPTAPAGPAPASRYLPAAVKRAVYERDGGQCAFVADDGRRCQERHALEFHHRHPFGRGGRHEPANIQLGCRLHNLLWANARLRPPADGTLPPR